MCKIPITLEEIAKLQQAAQQMAVSVELTVESCEDPADARYHARIAYEAAATIVGTLKELLERPRL